MSKLTKPQAKAHAEACALLTKDKLSEDERWFVMENWQESANHINSIAGAFFTPVEMASTFSIEIPKGATVIDLCAGIGTLSFFAQNWQAAKRIVCVELNPDYITVGRKIVPEAEWIQADALGDLSYLGQFDCAIGNPPFGSTKRTAKPRRYSGPTFEYHLIDAGSDVADYGVFIVPQMSAPFRYSGEPCYSVRKEDGYRRFAEQTSIDLEANCGIDTSVWRNQWHGVAPATEIVLADLSSARRRREASMLGPLFAEAAE